MLDTIALPRVRPLRDDLRGAGGPSPSFTSEMDSFKYVSAIEVKNTNVWPHPIALHAARVYLRGCDARPDAREHSSEGPVAWDVRHMRTLRKGPACLYRFSNESRPTVSPLR
jgi:hypothetical protein